MEIDPVMMEIIGGFVPEAKELCDKVASEILRIEQKPDGPAPTADTYKSLARGLHTLKGTAATLGLDDLSTIGHGMEDVVAPFHHALGPLPSAVADELLRVLDLFMTRLQSHAEGRSGDLPDAAAIIGRLRELASSPAPVTIATPDKVAPAAAPTTGEESPTSARSPIPSASMEAPNQVDAVAEANVSDDQSGWRVNSRNVVALFREAERMREIRLRMIERRRVLDSTIAAVTKLATIPETASLYTQLVAIRQALQSDGEELGDMVDSLEGGIKTICTLPVRTIVDPLHRAVRDLCRLTGKEAALAVIGAELSLDRRILEKLKGPLVHLIRNALDHGIEPVAVRKERGKHRAGALVIRVEQQGNMIFIEVGDDGSGLDFNRIREVAVARQLYSSDELSRMTPEQVAQIVFEPGFSTRAQVSGTSGRGVGMDVVLSEVQALGGTIQVKTTAGQGSRFSIAVPADLGSSPTLLVRCGEYSFGVPVISVESIVAARRERIRFGDHMKLEHRDELLDLLDLGHMLRLREPDVPGEGQPLLIIHAQGQRVALLVDEVIGNRDQVIQPLPDELRSLPAYQGASIQGSGELLLVLRGDWLAQPSHSAKGVRSAARRVLVVDDSLTARAMHRAVLEASGYSVHAVGSARGALDQLRHSAYDVIVCDVAMDEMDGFALTSRLRAEPGTSTIPIMLVSMGDGEIERSKGIAAGADGFLSKKDCASGRLVAEISSVIARRQVLTP
ncbi:MAG TPA: response regulator [Polyangiaceae bacterium]|nr:response regulator [Polyangiaceae bacterium]